MQHLLHGLLKQALDANAISLEESAIQKLIYYLEQLQAWNRVFNLTTITEPSDMVYLHVMDSLSVRPFLYGTRLLDVGSGAGLPGIPLAIACPHLQWVLLDKNSKKTRFLTQVIADLELTNIKIIHERCEDFHPAHCFDSILSRAFGTLATFVEINDHLLCPHGKFIAMKGKYPHDELNHLPKRFLAQEVVRLNIQGMTAERHIVSVLKKT